jgi:hypothetical protein
MAQSKLKKTVAAAALSGLMLGAVGYIAGCSHQDKAGAQASTSADAGVQHACKGMNACKGQGGCKTSDNGCKGKNSCKGKGGCKSM